MIHVIPQHKNVVKCAAREVGPYAINGVCIESNGTLVATDGRRLVALKAERTADNPGDAHDVIVSQETIAEGCKLAAKWAKSGKRDVVAITNCTPSQCKVAAPGTEATYPTVDGTFPQWRDVVPALDRLYAAQTLVSNPACDCDWSDRRASQFESVRIACQSQSA